MMHWGKNGLERLSSEGSSNSYKQYDLKTESNYINVSKFNMA